ncbi:ABC transporter permease [Desulfuromonas sp. KJ2020]|uniref:ABC transporter permease subunit n=1 Tax=Desulfuromonas sp. KJ2020 TaxID=2919173 RepID=UPI0020A6F70B|nr:ABC transporter permease subunit [Desulfuromonas sp. KJ2020]MCP3177402.1 ABC transporter permease [Desulfuromonas sp. KJ2020]
MSIAIVTFKGIIRDRVPQGILSCALIFLVIPAVSALSMRQVTELSLTLSLSLVSFLLLLLAIFLGSVSLWRDVERRYTHGVLTLPISRGRYVVGRFVGISTFLFGTVIFLGGLTLAVVAFVSATYVPERAVAWTAVIAALGFEMLQCLLLVGFAVLFSSVSTSFFLPVFGSLAVYLVGGASQQAYDYVLSPAGQTLTPLVRQVAEVLYYILPNFSAFDLKVNAIYALPLDPSAIALTACYGLLYTAFVLILAAAIYSRRELG